MKKALPLSISLALLGATPLLAQVNGHEVNQERRIIQGERSGELTRGEANHLQRQQSRIDTEVARDRAANGGTLTPAERARVNAQQSRASGNIADKKHNGLVR